MSDLISVVVPIYNVEKYLTKCIDSIINQTYKNLEIILVDDGSPDNCGKICDEYKKKDNRIKVIHKKNGGLSDARNEGIKIATGKYIGFIDSDDFVSKDMYKKLYDSIKKYDAEISVCSRNILYENGKVVPYCINDGRVIVMDSTEALKKIFGFRDFDMAAWDKLYSIKLFNKIKYPVGRINEDYYVTPLLFSKANRIVYIRESLYNYLRRENSITSTKTIKFDSIYASNFIVKYYEKNYNSILYIAKTAQTFAYIGIVNKFIECKLMIDKKFLKKAQKNAMMNFKSILKNNNVNIIKRFQVLIFCISFNLYKLVFNIVKWRLYWNEKK